MRWVFAILLASLPACLLLTEPDVPWPCTTNADCSADTQCRFLYNNFTYKCVAPDACFKDNDCQDHGYGYTCASGTCLAPECATDAACAPFRCLGFNCARTCGSDEQCASGYSCVGNTCVRTLCSGPTPCRGHHCSDGQCATSCNRSGCEPGYECRLDRCQCAPGSGVCGAYVCAGGVCRTSCSINDDCATGYRCHSGSCVRCVGTPLGCANQPKCAVVAGCTASDLCEGGILDCATLSTTVCPIIKGCSVAGSACVGTASCADLTVASCSAFKPCAVGKSCAGTVIARCAEQPVAGCEGIAGCKLE